MSEVGVLIVMMYGVGCSPWVSGFCVTVVGSSLKTGTSSSVSELGPSPSSLSVVVKP